MNIKHSKLLFVAGIIDTLLGMFYFICGILEFTDMLSTKAHNVTETIGVQLSYLVFVSTILIIITGVLTILNHKSLRLLNLRVFTGVVALAWPLFLSITLFFTQFQINIRLMTMSLASLFYIIAVLIVKISNDEFSKSVNFNPSAMIASSGKRARSVDINAVMSAGTGKLHQKNIMQTVESLTANVKTKRSHGGIFQGLFVGKRKLGSGNVFRGFYGGHKRRSANITSLFNGKRRRPRRFRK